ncbi:hypothetical protein EG328_007201 [Venturia inaequalis]|uniref:Actin-like ATPase domain-containing protein n=1 Tax=Venturia inaequalis TaxID=5025 RepID=A0A8H3UEU6_VENIN|nr:hypothetical protein EG328_007201 [Venturia inaequalis]KAE9985997.1 hypothetical protein EG327_004481 [Venturia inaequalis]RDI83538.1 hypothetical protein Vi05172_g6763 [Venturia inaequalis]
MNYKKLATRAPGSRGRQTLANRPRLICGIDFGTTQTGISVVNSTKKAASEVEIIRKFPGPSKHANEVWKVPSIIAYRDENSSNGNSQNHNGNTEIWGYLVTPGMVSYCWFKMRLDDDTKQSIFDVEDIRSMKSVQGTGMGSLPHGKDATEVCGDFLRGIHGHLMQFLENRYSAGILKITPIEFWLTHPATWSDKAKSATREAARQAGFLDRKNDELFMIPEPEAAAIAALSDNVEQGVPNQVSPGDVISITDCGGGTVDLTTYEVMATKPLNFREVVVGVGGKCGSTTIDQMFFVWMEECFDDDFKNLPFDRVGPGSRFMQEFESRKRDFGADDEVDDDYEISLVMPGVRTSKHYDSRKSVVKLTKVQMESFFRGTVKKIQDLLAQQIEDTKTKLRGKGINTIILVGGFAESQYLVDKLIKWCDKKYGHIKLFSPKNAQAAIVKGAALRGLGNIKPIQRRCRRHYGFVTAQDFRDEVDPEHLLWIDEWDGTRKCHNRMHWQIGKGDPVKEGTYISHEITENYLSGAPRVGEVELLCCDDDAAPEFGADKAVKNIGKIEFDFKKLVLRNFEKQKVKGRNLYLVTYEIRVLLSAEQGTLQFEVWSEEKLIGNATIDYSDDIDMVDDDNESDE